VIAQTWRDFVRLRLARRFCQGTRRSLARRAMRQIRCAADRYHGSDFAELLGAHLMPVWCYGVATMRTAEESPGVPCRGRWRLRGSVLAYGFPMAPGGVMASYSVAIIFAWAPWGKNLCGLCGAARAIGMGFGYIFIFCPRPTSNAG